MGHLQQLNRLVESGNKSNIDLVREMVKSPALFKYRGVLRRCGMRKPSVSFNGGVRMDYSPCNCQARVVCDCCERAVFKSHFNQFEGECTECRGRDTHFYINPNPTEAYIKRVISRNHHFWLRDEAGQMEERFIPGWNAAFSKHIGPFGMRPSKRTKKEPLGESNAKVKHNPRPSRFGFLEGLKNHKRR